MILNDLNQGALSKLISQQVYYVTCMECCKYYVAPETASCGHTLCHGCWSGRRTCPVCALPLNRKTLKLNIPLQTLLEHTHALGDAFEKLFNVKLAEMELETDKENDPIKNVKDWLASSQNHFSAPITSSQLSIDDMPKPVELSASKIQIHSHTENLITNTETQVDKNKVPFKKLPSVPPQDDWDKIEILPDSEEITSKYKETTTNSKESTTLPIFVDGNEYSTDNPRRSSRNREIKSDIEEKGNISVDKQSSKKTTQNWNNVKKMRKEFSKLNKRDRNKLNVSIEMCKKAQSIKKGLPLDSNLVGSTPLLNEDLPVIEDHTSDVVTKNCDMPNKIKTLQKLSVTSLEEDTKILKINEIQPMETSSHLDNTPSNENMVQKHKSITNRVNKNSMQISESNITLSNSEPKTNKMVFLKKGNLCQNTCEPGNIKITHKELDVTTATSNKDDIEISIKVGNTVTNILIKKKENDDVQMKVNTDREIQTSIGPYTHPTKDAICSPLRFNSEISKNKKSIESSKKNTASADTISPPLQKKDAACSPIKFSSAICRNKKTNESINKNTDSADSISTPLQKKDAACSPTKLSSEICKNQKTVESIKKNTDSADTASAHFEITESVEKEISNLMEHEENATKATKSKSKTPLETDKSQTQINSVKLSVKNKVVEDEIDMFCSGSVKETSLQFLKDLELVPSEILVPTNKSRKSQNVDKRNRVIDESEMPHKKKQKLDIDTDKNTNIVENLQENEGIIMNESENMNYDAVMSQVFASIDADIRFQKGQKNEIAHLKTDKGDNTQKNLVSSTSHQIKNNSKDDQKYSENIFSILDKDSEPAEAIKGNQIAGPETQDNIKKLLTPGMLQDLVSTAEDEDEINDVEMQEPNFGTPMLDGDESDKSVVEETPQKNVSFQNPKQKSEITNKTENRDENSEQKGTSEKKNPKEVHNKNNDSQIIKSIISISDTLPEASKTHNVSAVETNDKKYLETPITINKFVNHIQHKSTPVARKSLNFDSTENVENLEQTLCPTATQQKESQQNTMCPTTQEKEILAKVFEQTPSPKSIPLKQKKLKINETKKFYLAGSCLSALELSKVKKLCSTHGWTFVDKYTKDLTHLVVGVDDENKSQRSVKFMCALAASKWIVSFAWVEKCLQTGTVVDEQPYEALDATGDPGPRLSRTASRKLFEGFTFFCMPPFTILDVEYLKYMLEAAGGNVVSNPREVKVTPGRPPSILLAEPEHTQEDKFIYLAMELCIVPVNYEWVLNCFGSYCLSSFYDLLLCPSTLLPPACNLWPPELLMRDKDDD